VFRRQVVYVIAEQFSPFSVTQVIVQTLFRPVTKAFGIWEVRSGPKQFTHSKVMAWVAVDRAVRSMEEFGEKGPLEQSRELRRRIHESVCNFGFNQAKNSFVQSFGSERLDASLLMMPLVGFLPAKNPRILGTVAAIERELLSDGVVARYRTDDAVDGIQEPEGVFSPAVFGSLTTMYRKDAKKKRRVYSGACLRFKTMWACCRKSTIP
jgi:GH15 family glucan-1,4-alpha-glucosidase